jgi:hypothetical protein
MEIALVQKTALRIKGKHASIAVDPVDKTEINAALAFAKKPSQLESSGAEVVIEGPGEYEAGGINISGLRSETGMIYSMTVDSVSILLGKGSSLEKMQQKLKESNILIVHCDDIIDPAFLTSLVSSVIIFYGEKAVEIGKAFGGESIAHVSKYSTTIDKLPAEVETIIFE